MQINGHNNVKNRVKETNTIHFWHLCPRLILLLNCFNQLIFALLSFRSPSLSKLNFLPHPPSLLLVKTHVSSFIFYFLFVSPAKGTGTHERTPTHERNLITHVKSGGRWDQSLPLREVSFSIFHSPCKLGSSLGATWSAHF